MNFSKVPPCLSSPLFPSIFYEGLTPKISSSFSQLNRSAQIFLILVSVQTLALLGLGISVFGLSFSLSLILWILWTGGRTLHAEHMPHTFSSSLVFAVTGADSCQTGYSCEKVYSVIYIFVTGFFSTFAFDAVRGSPLSLPYSCTPVRAAVVLLLAGSPCENRRAERKNWLQS